MLNVGAPSLLILQEEKSQCFRLALFAPPSSESKKRFQTDTRPKASPKLTKVSRKCNKGLEPNDQSDWPADFGGGSCDSSAPTASPPLNPASAPENRIPLEQFEELGELVIETTQKFLGNNVLSPDDDGESLDQDPVLSGHPLHHLLSKARTFTDRFREHRMPSSLDEDILPQPPKVKAGAQWETYARRIIRATVPTGHQKRAKWRNFVARSSTKLNKMISGGHVKLFRGAL